MCGFSEITYNNGWVIAILGICIVFSGLAALCIVISQFVRFLNWWKPQSHVALLHRLMGIFLTPIKEKVPNGAHHEIAEAGDSEDAETFLRMLTTTLGEPFKLPQLLEIAKKRDLVRPHSQINRFLLEGAIVGGPDGLFRWRKMGHEEKRPPLSKHT